MNLTPALSGIAYAALAFTAVLTVGLSTDEPREVEFTTTAPAITALDAMSAARDYAATHGLTDCRTPGQAELDDVILAVPTDSTGVVVSLDVQAVGFDAALESGGVRRNLLACDEGK